MKVIKSCLVSLFLMLIGMSANAATDLSGNYTCKGYDPYANIKYTGPVTVKKTGKNTYSMTWSLGKDQTYSGTALFNEDTSTLGALFYSAENVNTAGIEIYQVQTDGSLRGIWTMNGASRVGSEDCVKH